MGHLLGLFRATYLVSLCCIGCVVALPALAFCYHPLYSQRMVFPYKSGKHCWYNYDRSFLFSYDTGIIGKLYILNPTFTIILTFAQRRHSNSRVVRERFSLYQISSHFREFERCVCYIFSPYAHFKPYLSSNSTFLSPKSIWIVKFSRTSMERLLFKSQNNLRNRYGLEYHEKHY